MNGNYAERLARGSAIVFVMLVVSGATGFLMRVFLARTLGDADYGLYISVFMFISMFGAFRDLGIGQAVVRLISTRGQYSPIKSSITILMLVQVLFSFTVASILIVFSNQISLSIFGTLEASLIIKVLSGWFLFQAIFFTFKTAFRGFQDIVSFSAMGFFEIFLPLFFAFSLLWILGANVANVALAYLVGMGATIFIALAIFVKKHTNIVRAKLDISKGLLKELFSFALPMLVGAAAGAIIGYMGTIALTMFRSLPEVGFYQVAYPAANLLLYFPAAIGAVLFPMVSELWSKRKHSLIEGAIRTLIKFSFIFIVPAAFVIIAFPNVVISTLFGSKYLAASVALQILALTAIVQTLYAILNKVILGIGKPVAITKILIIMGGINFVLNLILIPPYGIEGAAIAAFLSTLVGLSISINFARKYVRFTVPWSSLSKTLAGGLLTLLIVSGLKWIINLPPLLELFVVIIPSVLFYGAWILLTKALTWDDLLLLKNTIPIPRKLFRVARKLASW